MRRVNEEDDCCENVLLLSTYIPRSRVCRRTQPLQPSLQIVFLPLRHHHPSSSPSSVIFACHVLLAGPHLHEMNKVGYSLSNDAAARVVVCVM